MLPFDTVGNKKAWLVQLGSVNKSHPGVSGVPAPLHPKGRLLWEESLSLAGMEALPCPSLSPFHVNCACSSSSLTVKALPKVSEPGAATLPDSAGKPAQGPGRGRGGGDGLGRRKAFSVSSHAGLSDGRASGPRMRQDVIKLASTHLGHR